MPQGARTNMEEDARATKRVRTESGASDEKVRASIADGADDAPEALDAEFWAQVAQAADTETQPARRDLYLETSHAYFHAIDEEHHVFMNLATAQVYVLPENYLVEDPSLCDIQYQLSLTFSERQIAQLDAPDMPPTLDLNANPYLPGFVGLNNIDQNNAMNAVIQALAHVPPLRNYFLRGATPRGLRGGIEAKSARMPTVSEAEGRLLHSTELVQRFATLLRRIWNPHGFKGQVSPHEFLQQVAVASHGKFKLTEAADPVDFLGWLLNLLHFDLVGGPRAAQKRASIITACFQGELRIESQKVIVRTGLEEDQVDKLDHDGRRSGGQEDEHGNAKFNIDQEIKIDRSPFFLLTLDLPPPPVFQDEVAQNIVPQIPISHVLAKYDGISIQEANGMIRRYKLTRLPPYLILHFRRFTKNRFVEERNQTVINFPTIGLDLADYTDLPPQEGPTLGSVYNILANVTHEAAPGTVRDNSVWSCQVHTRLDGTPLHDTPDARHEEQWFQMQDLIVEKVNKQLLFLRETCIQIWEQTGAMQRVERSAESLVPRDQTSKKT
ncbi:hypothetical protein MVES_000338 [Malassezia vespertilionis]|uniref:USP domain-containing protein n=1 Tax=Malassezia vespertilionis TaxID=2020962 RepID=A0A2N1JFY7_9BASI|nr:hypothetical protein MVES_000338 [Malassezia vespertilionis]